MRLIDCFIILIVYVAHTVKRIEEDQPDFEALKNNIDKLLEKSMKYKEKGGFSDEDYQFARLSVCVWIDEALLNSPWEHKRLWQRELLQRRYYGISDGGMEFFDRLDKIGHEDRDVREVAYYCLSLGLSGRYVGKGDAVVLDHLRASNLKRLFGSSAGDPTLEKRQLFPEAYQKQSYVPPRKEKRLSWRAAPVILGLLPVGLFVALMVVYQYLLKSDLGKFTPM